MISKEETIAGLRDGSVGFYIRPSVNYERSEPYEQKLFSDQSVAFYDPSVISEPTGGAYWQKPITHALFSAPMNAPLYLVKKT